MTKIGCSGSNSGGYAPRRGVVETHGKGPGNKKGKLKTHLRRGK